MASNLRRFSPPLILILLVFVFYARLAFSDLILARGDTYAYFYPYWAARDAALSEGRLPLWSPDVFMGVPLLANSQLGTLYPPNWISPLFQLDPPNGIRVSILIHLAWAGLGAYLLARRRLSLNVTAATLAAVIFTFGGHIGAHIEQINQLQGLSWLPWLLYIFSWNTAGRGALISKVMLLGAALSLQFFTGHTQTVFISGVGMALYGLFLPHRVRNYGTLAAAGVLALILAAPQLIATFELTGLGNRQGGLNQNEATAFSLSPFMFGRGMLPSFDTSIFGEYVAYIGIVGISLAVVGVFAPTINGRGQKWAWVLLAFIGVFFAFGLYNPVYWTLAGLPGFNLFRVPARWLALFVLGAAMLGGMGLHHLMRGYRPQWRVLALIGGVVAVLAVGAQLAGRNLDGTPTSLATPTTMIAWGVILAAVLVLLAFPRLKSRATQLPIAALVLLATGELFFANLALPHNDLAPPEAWRSQRFSISQMQVYAQRAAAGIEPPSRMLSISNIYFDPGDRAALEARYRSMELSEVAIRHAFVAIKLKEVIAPNLSLAWGIPSIDGFDGGLLPTHWYSAFASLLLPEGAPRTTDGRLRELLAREDCFGACVPRDAWLQFADVGYLILDKVYDIWFEDVAYDIGLPQPLTRSNHAIYANPYDFHANALDIAYVGADFAAFEAITLYGAEGEPISVEAVDEAIPLATHGEQTVMRVRVPIANESAVQRVEIGGDGVTVLALTLVDTETGDFQQLAPVDWQRVLSSDIKIYESQAEPTRAAFYTDWQLFPDTYAGTEAALAALETSETPTTLTLNTDAVIEPIASQAAGDTSIEFIEYTAERVVMRVNAPHAGMLVLKDAFYPGWVATIDGTSVPIYRANVMFRGVYIPAGEHEIMMEFQPNWLIPSLFIAGFTWVCIIILQFVRWTSIKFIQISSM